MSRVCIEWLVVVLWMGLIFVMSTDLGSGEHSSGLIMPILRALFPHAAPAPLDHCHFLLRKLGHLTEYAVLGLLVLRAVRDTWHLGWSWSTFGLALLVTAVYAASDEFHQSFVPSRGASVVDVGIDTAGASIGLVLAYVFRRSRKPQAA
jgi:VanZ family protein